MARLLALSLSGTTIPMVAGPRQTAEHDTRVHYVQLTNDAYESTVDFSPIEPDFRHFRETAIFGI
jgi:hypothetical protein